MAREITLLCDKCGGKKEVKQVTIPASDTKYVSDLCAACVKKLLSDYSFTSTMRSNRTVRVWDDPDDIPRNTL
jgi:hypothetical protein